MSSIRINTNFPDLEQINSSSASSASSVSKWSQELAEKANKDKSFIHIGIGNKLPNRYITGYNNSWGARKPEENNYIFIPSLRVVGSPENIRIALKAANFSPQQIESAIRGGISKDNYQQGNFALLLKDEIEARRLVIQEVKRPKFSSEEMIRFADIVKSEKGKVLKKQEEPTAKVVAKKSPKAKRDTLRAAIDSLNSGEVVDVSNFNATTGKGFKVIPMVKTGTGSKFGSGLPLISSNINNYISAVGNAYGPNGIAQYAVDIENVRYALENRGKGKNNVIVSPSDPYNNTGRPSSTRISSPGAYTASKSILPQTSSLPAGSPISSSMNRPFGERTSSELPGARGNVFQVPKPSTPKSTLPAYNAPGSTSPRSTSPRSTLSNIPTSFTGKASRPGSMLAPPPTILNNGPQSPTLKNPVVTRGGEGLTQMPSFNR